MTTQLKSYRTGHFFFATLGVVAASVALACCVSVSQARTELSGAYTLDDEFVELMSDRETARGGTIQLPERPEEISYLQRGNRGIDIALNQVEDGTRESQEERSRSMAQAESLYQQGEVYATGNNGQQTPDWAEAVKYYRRAANLNHAVAMTRLGSCYYCGRGAAKDLAEAFHWFQRAANAGDPCAYVWLGDCYTNGAGTVKESSEANKMYQKFHQLAKMPSYLNDKRIQYNLGWSYDNGSGVAKDATEAVKWYRKAAEQGDASAQYNLGVCYDDGSGIAKDVAEAVKWYCKAAEQRFANAQYNLGVCYNNGFGVKKDVAEAVKWYQKAAEQGDEDAKKALNRLQ